MKRYDCLKAIYSRITGELVVTIMGATAQELYELGDRENFFYLEHAMGLASSLGFGLALSIPQKKVIVLDGDGSVLMNLGTLATLARYRPANLVHVIFDNANLFSTGGFPSHTADGVTDLAAVARGAGCPLVTTAESVDQFVNAIGDGMEAAMMSTVVARVDASGPERFGMDIHLPEMTFRLARWIKRNAGAV